MIQQQRPNHSFAKQAARAALAPNQNISNIQRPPHPLKQQITNNSSITDSKEIDRIVESVTNATKRLSQISTSTNSYERKSKSHVGPWRLGRTLGRGSTGRVRLAKHSETGQLAAVKIVPKSKFQKKHDDDDKNLSPYGIEREIIIMKLISHENIMGLYDVWENKGELYLVLEYVEGGELFDYLIKKGKLDEAEAVHYFRQIISGVGYCHQFNICHRDLKPENLLLDKNFNIKIADFGMAALEMNQKLLETSCGSPHYASPEIVAGKTYHGSPSDVWSCGIILFALLTGHLPFDDENIRKLLMKVQSGKFVTPNFLSLEAKDLIWKMLKVNPKERINVFDILKHPLLKKYENSETLNSKQTDKLKLETYYSEVDSLQISRDNIDRDLLTSLSILFHGVKESSLIPKLLEPRSNPEKIFYYLLLQYKKKHQLRFSDELKSKNSKKKVTNGDGLLKKSKSTVRTTIIDHDGSTTVTVDTVKESRPISQPLPKTPSKKKITRNHQSQLQISASSTYRRGVSFNNKQISSQIPSLSRSSSKTKINTTDGNKKRHSILPPLPDLDADWLKLDPNGLGSKEFASMYAEIFNHYQASPDQSPKKGSSKPLASKNKDSLLFTSSPMPVKKKEHRDLTKINNSDQKKEEDVDEQIRPVQKPKELGDISQPSSSNPQSNARRFVSEPLGNKKVKNLSTLKLSTLMDFKAYEDPTESVKKKSSTLDPKYGKRGISNNNAEVLNKFGLNVKGGRTRSKIFYSKSSTSMDLSSILNHADQNRMNQFIENDVKSNDNGGVINSEFRKTSVVPPLPEHRVSSSNYASFEGSDFNSSIDDASFDFEVPAETEVAQAIQISNGSDLTIGKNVQAREDSMFEDIDNIEQDKTDCVLRSSNSSRSVIKHHKRAVSSDMAKPAAQPMDIRGSLFNPSEFKEDSVPDILNHSTHGYQRPRHLEADDDLHDDSKSTIIDNSLYADHTDDDNEFANAKRVTMIFDDQDEHSYFHDSPVNVPSTFKVSPTRPMKTSPLKQVQDNSFKITRDASFLGTKKFGAPVLKNENTPQRDVASIDSEGLHKSNWFTRFFSSLISSSSENNRKQDLEKKKKRTKIFTPKRPMSHTRQSIRNVLEIKRKEGTLTALNESGNVITATIPPRFALGKPLKFEIMYDETQNQIKLTKVKGSKKIFKNLLEIMEYVVDNGSF